jgi:hypothetical protein
VIDKVGQQPGCGNGLGAGHDPARAALAPRWNQLHLRLDGAAG